MSREPKKGKQSTQLQAALDALFEHNCMVDVREGIQTFLIYANNILKNPEEPKYRKIRLANINFQERLGHLKGGKGLLRHVGFEDKGDFMVMPAGVHTKADQKALKELHGLTYNTLHKLNETFGELNRHGKARKWVSVAGCGEASTIGRRQSMEDDWYAFDNFADTKELGLFCVYDGHGGRQTVDFITRAFWRNLAHTMGQQPSQRPSEWFESVYARTDAQVRRQRILQSGSTAVTCIVRKEGASRVLYAANVGDSRCVLCRDEKAIRLTLDHKASDTAEAARVEKDGGFVGRFNRVNGLLAITRAFGDHLLKPAVSAVPYQTRTVLTPGDRFMILACDGVWDVLTDQEGVQFVLETMPKLLKEAGHEGDEPPPPKTLNECLVKCAEALIEMSMDRRSMDNISVMIVWF